MNAKKYQLEQQSENIRRMGHVCPICEHLREDDEPPTRATQRAHIIPQRMGSRFGWIFIDHWSNFLMTCQKHNSYAQVNTNDTDELRERMRVTYTALSGFDFIGGISVRAQMDEWVDRCVGVVKK